jgi:hypothetical protein
MEFLRPAHRDGVRADGLQRSQVLGHVALQGENSDHGRH